MAIIVPAILEETPDGFLDKLSRVGKLPNMERIQVDFGDGKFVPHQTLSVLDMDALNPAYTWEAHLMVEEPVDFLDFQIAGFNILVVHYEAFTRKDQIKPTLEQIRKLGMKTGLALNTETSVSVCPEFADLVDQFLLMSIVPGFQGRPFIEDTYTRVNTLRSLVPHAIIEVDGGIKEKNVKPLVEAGTDLLVVGSALFETENVQENYDKLTKETI